MPVAGLALFAVLPLPAALALYLPATAVSIAVALPAVRALARPVTTGTEGMRGKEALVTSAAGRSGTIRLEGELWSVRAREPLAAGDRVRILEMEGLTAVVRRVQEAAGNPTRATTAGGTV